MTSEANSKAPNEDDLKKYLMKEIDTIQSTIRRMSSNSFLIKGWTITLVVVTLLLKGTEEQACIAFIPLLVFWFLDSYYLRQERMYRKLYDWVIANRLQTDEHLFNMNAYRFEKNVGSKFRIMFSTTLIWFYGSIAALIVIYQIFILYLQEGIIT